MALQCFALELDVTTTDVADTSFDTSRSEKKLGMYLKLKMLIQKLFKPNIQKLSMGFVFLQLLRCYTRLFT